MTQQPTESPQITLEQKRARHAWRNVEYVAGKDDKFRKDYGSYVRGLPALILSDGLGMTLAFLCAKGKKDSPPDKAKKENAYTEVYQHVSAWVTTELSLGVNGDALLDWVVNTANSTQYRRATAEALAYLAWLKRFTEAKGWKSDESGE